MKHLERTFIGGGLLAATIGAGMVLAGGKSQSGGFDNSTNNRDVSFNDNAATDTNSTKAEIVMDAGVIVAIIGTASVALGMRKPGRQRSTFQP